MFIFGVAQNKSWLLKETCFFLKVCFLFGGNTTIFLGGSELNLLENYVTFNKCETFVSTTLFKGS